MLRRFKKTAYWLLFLPLSTILLLELVLQAGSSLNQHFLHKNIANTWLTQNLRIVTMGDSNTYGLYLDKEDSYPKQLETIWNTTHKNKAIEVINLGYPGTNSSRLVANFEEAIKQFQPDIVLVMIGTNDSWTTPIASAESRLIEQNAFQPIQRIKLYSRIYKLYCLLSREPFQGDALAAITTSDPKQTETAKGQPATINYKNIKLDFSMSFRPQSMHFDVEVEMQKNMEKLIQYGENHNIKVFLVTYAANKGYYKQANKVTIRTAQAINAITSPHLTSPHLIDTIATFKNLQPEKDKGNIYFFPDLHTTAQGNQILATEIMKQLETKLNTSSEETKP